MTKINFSEEFELIRPYNDQEVCPAIRRLISYPSFDAVLSYLFPDRSLNDAKESLLEIKTIVDFQAKFMHYAVSFIVKKTSSGLTVSGQQNLDPEKPYLFVSNHRDIVLDAAILQVILLDNGHKTSQITFGSNLMISPMIIDFGKLNRMFTFYRGGSRIEMYKHALLHSAYIRDAIVSRKESVWIAQRNGRTKDGNDNTQSALLKMFIGNQSNPIQALSDLNIVPMAVSYEYEPCDTEKTREIYLSGKQEYIKDKNEDFKSVLSGIISSKGKIHFSFGTPINSYLDKVKEGKINHNNLCDLVAAEIDRQIQLMFNLCPNNYIASDMLSDKPVFNQHYTTEEFIHFKEYVSQKINSLSGDKNELTKLFLQLYAKPVDNRFNKIITEPERCSW